MCHDLCGEMDLCLLCCKMCGTGTVHKEPMGDMAKGLPLAAFCVHATDGRDEQLFLLRLKFKM
jgi:hypothetical protein